MMDLRMCVVTVSASCQHPAVLTVSTQTKQNLQKDTHKIEGGSKIMRHLSNNIGEVCLEKKKKTSYMLFFPPCLLECDGVLQPWAHGCGERAGGRTRKARSFRVVSGHEAPESQHTRHTNTEEDIELCWNLGLNKSSCVTD